MIENIIWIIDNVDSIKILPSAYKHGISDADIKYAVRNNIDYFEIAEDPTKVLFIGFDRANRELEVIIVELRNGEFAINHAMKVRKGTLEFFERHKHGN